MPAPFRYLLEPHAAAHRAVVLLERLWLGSVGLAAIIATALCLSTAYAGKARTGFDRWQIFRLT